MMGKLAVALAHEYNVLWKSSHGDEGKGSLVPRSESNAWGTPMKGRTLVGLCVGPSGWALKMQRAT